MPSKNQFCYLLSTSTSISLRLNPSDFLLALETFNKEDIFIYIFLDQNIFVSGHQMQNTHSFVPSACNSMLSYLMACIWLSRPYRSSFIRVTKKFHVYIYNISVSLFSSCGMHQSQYLDGCQAMGKSTFFLLRPFEPYVFYNHHTAQCHIFSCYCVTDQSGTYLRVHGFLRIALLHTFSVFKRLGTSAEKRGSMSTSLSHITCVST